MKKIIVMTCLGFVTALSSIAQDNSPALTRANHLSDQMIRELRLNNYQATRLRAVNQDKATKLKAIEDKYANNPAAAEKDVQGIYKERDKDLQSFLSTEQYSKYFSSRLQYNKADQEFAVQIGAKPDATAKRSKIDLPIGNKEIPVVNRTNAVLRPDSK